MIDEFNPQKLMAEAQTRSGFFDFGDPAFKEPLAVYARSLDEEAGLSDAGRAGMREGVLGYLQARLMMEQYYHLHPEIEDEELGDPLIIVGLPRTGTTMLYRMLAAADGLDAPLHYEAAAVSPPFDWDYNPSNDSRIPAAETQLVAMMEAVPDIASIYPFEAQAPEEDIYLYAPSFCTTSMQSSARTPSYERWFDNADKAPAYRYLKRALKLLQWQRRKAGISDGAGRWLLKTPDHIHSLDALIDAFPGAKIIQTHRDPVDTIPSISSFIRALHQLTANEVDSEALGQEWCRMFAKSMKHALGVREAHPEKFLDISYKDTVADPHKVAEAIFEFLGEELDNAAWAEMQKWRDANKREARPSHKYTLEEFGLTADQVRLDFADYRATYLGMKP